MNTESFQTELVQSAIELAHLIKGDRHLLEKSLYEQGSGVVGIFCDSNFKDSFQNMRELKVDILTNAIEDLATGGGRLLLATLGITYQTGKLQPYIEMLGAAPGGNIIYSINLKQRAAFKHWRDIEQTAERAAQSGEDFELSQTDINAAIYRLTVALSEVL